MPSYFIQQSTLSRASSVIQNTIPLVQEKVWFHWIFVCIYCNNIIFCEAQMVENRPGRTITICSGQDHDNLKIFLMWCQMRLNTLSLSFGCCADHGHPWSAMDNSDLFGSGRFRFIWTKRDLNRPWPIMDGRDRPAPMLSPKCNHLRSSKISMIGQYPCCSRSAPTTGSVKWWYKWMRRIYFHFQNFPETQSKPQSAHEYTPHSLSSSVTNFLNFSHSLSPL